MVTEVHVHVLCPFLLVEPIKGSQKTVGLWILKKYDSISKNKDLPVLNYVKDLFSGLWVHQGLLLRPTL